jgi:hypothetical protein
LLEWKTQDLLREIIDSEAGVNCHWSFLGG